MMAVDLLFAARNSRAALKAALDYLDERLSEPAVRAMLQAAIAVQDVAIGNDKTMVREIDSHPERR